MRQNDRKPLEQFTACICNKCGEIYEADREHICKKKNSYQRAENHFSKLDEAVAFDYFLRGITNGGYNK